MKKYIQHSLIIICIISINGVFAQKDNRAESLLNKVYNKMVSFDDVEIQFEYALENTSENVRQKTQGTLLTKENRYKLTLMGVTKLFDGTHLYSIIPDNEEVIIETNPKIENDFSPSKLISFYKKGYAYKWDILQTVSKNKKIRYIELIPIKKTSDFRKLLIGIETKKSMINNIIQIGKQGTRTTLTLIEIKTNQHLEDSVFDFDKSYYEDLDYYIVEE